MSSNQIAEITLQDVSFDEEHIHDQLPTVDEMKVHVAPTRNVRRTVLTFVGVVVTTLLVATFATVGVVVTNKKADRTAAELALRFENVMSFLSNHTEPAALTDASSPQRRAAEWMAYEDALVERKLPTNKDREWTFLQRYAPYLPGSDCSKSSRSLG